MAETEHGDFMLLKVRAAHLGAFRTPCLGDSAAVPAHGAQAHFEDVDPCQPTSSTLTAA
jgi:hypothetical protein